MRVISAVKVTKITKKYSNIPVTALFPAVISNVMMIKYN